MPKSKVNYQKFNYFRVKLVRDESVTYKIGESVMHSNDFALVTREIIDQKGCSDREQMVLILLDAKNKIIGTNILTFGTTTCCSIFPKEIIKIALLSNAAALLLAHNHPSGDVSPSSEDLQITKKMYNLCMDMGLGFHDHIIVSCFDKATYSFAGEGYMQRFERERSALI